jgi:hypothetical protein
MAEPWRNGMVEQFNDRYRKMFLHKKILLRQKNSTPVLWPLSSVTITNIVIVSSRAKPH